MPRLYKTEEIRVCNFDVILNRKAVKNITLYVKRPDAHIEITAPRNSNICEIEAFVKKKKSWIEKQIERIKHSNSYDFENASKEEINSWRRVVENKTPELVEKWSSIIGVCPKQVTYRNMKSQWGSCIPTKGKICINIRLARYPEQCLEYVVIHELIHFKERGHGANFYFLMDKYYPNWKQIKKLLNR